MQDSVKTAFFNYTQNQSPENFLCFRDAVAASPDYSPYSDYKETVYDLIENEKFKQAKEYMMSVMPIWFFNPGIHELISFVLHELGEEKEAQIEFQLAMLLLDGILSTGDGSKKRPYLVLSVSDEYDVIEHFDKKVTMQSLVNEGNIQCDLMEFDDKTSMYFDITVPYSNFGKQLNPDEDEPGKKKKWWKLW
ncbi:MAG: DUF4919 domain-containing protein [Desulfobacteraceae bacterium]|nr:DUF4919 domain-containing protein [Desulfobacteraceae bacterium]